MPVLIDRDDLAAIDFSDVSDGDPIGPVLPGDVLRIEFMEPLHLSARELARRMDVPPNRVTEIVQGRRAVTARTAVRLAKALGTSAEFWMNLQTSHDLELEGWPAARPRPTAA